MSFSMFVLKARGKHVFRGKKVLDGTGRDGTGRDGTGRDGTGRDGTWSLVNATSNLLILRGGGKGGLSD